MRGLGWHVGLVGLVGLVGFASWVVACLYCSDADPVPCPACRHGLKLWLLRSKTFAAMMLELPLFGFHVVIRRKLPEQIRTVSFFGMMHE